jgi:hypothetical protein
MLLEALQELTLAQQLLEQARQAVLELLDFGLLLWVNH